MKLPRNWFFVAASKISLSLMVLAFSAMSFAGETLYLKKGAIRISQEDSQSAVSSGAANEKVYLVVQFGQTIRQEDQKNLTSLGAEILRYLPDDAYIVKVERRKINTILASSPRVRAISDFRNEWKVSPQINPVSVFNQMDISTYSVYSFNRKEMVQLTNFIQRQEGVTVMAVGDTVVSVRCQQKLLPVLAAAPGVEWIEPTPEIETMDLRLQEDAQPGLLNVDYSDITGYESGTKVMNFDTAWSRGFNGAGEIASMADTGLDSGNVPTLAADFKGRVTKGYSFGLFAQSWEDPMGHGTHVAGSVVGSGVTSSGKIKGGAYGATFIAEGMWSPMMNNLSVPPKLANLFDSAFKDGARIHTNSWGAGANFGAYDGMANQVDTYTNDHPDFLVLFAAGNNGQDLDKDGRIDENSISSPGTSKNALTVGASKNYVLKGGIQKSLKDLKSGIDKWGVEPLASSQLSENAGGLAPFSSRGPTADGRLKPEIVAPGTNILSARSHVNGADLLWGEYNADYLWCGGTSMATPLTAGAATVARQYLRTQHHLASPSAALVKATLMHTAKDLFPGQFGALGRGKGQELLKTRPNSDEGYGLVDMDAATNMKQALVVDEKSGVAQGEQNTYTVDFQKSGTLSATLVWTDYPGSPTAAKALVNNLDLVVRDSQGRETNVSDAINNNEHVEIPASAGHYEIIVKGTSVPQTSSGKQSFALVVSLQ